VFVAGMPRSGTSLIDQIIDAHPRASGVGELAAIEGFAARLSEAYQPELDPPRCFGRYGRFRWTRVAREYVKQIRGLAPDADRVVNKALGNNKLVGLLARLFPRTRVITRCATRAMSPSRATWAGSTTACTRGRRGSSGWRAPGNSPSG
jgi:hypothetical protein